MASRLLHWLEQISLADPIERRQALLMQLILLGLLGCSVLGVLYGATRELNAAALSVYAAEVLTMLCSIVSLFLVRSGRNQIAILVITFGLIAAITIPALNRGLHTNSLALFLFAFPLAFGCLLGGPRIGLLAYLATAVVVVFAAPVESQTPPPAPVALISAYLLLGGLYSFCLIIFGNSFRQSLQALRTTNQQLTSELEARERTLAALRETEDNYRMIAENSRDLVMLCDERLTYIYSSPSHQQVLGYSTVELIGRPVLGLVHPDDLELLRWRDLERSQRHRQTSPEPVTFRYRHANGSWRWLEAIWDRIVQGDLSYILITARDVTDRKGLEAQLLQSQKLDTVGRLAGGVAHDFNNLLTAISGYADLALESLSPDHPAVSDVHEIRKASDRAAGVTRRLLAFARKQHLELQVIDLNDHILEMDRLLRRLIGEAIELVTAPAPERALIKADPNLVEQVIVNLVVNARDAMPEGGRLVIQTREVVVDMQQTSAHIGIIPGQYVALTISDTGIGMDQRLQEHIFEPFFTTKPPGQGTGLGLATSYGIVKQHGGHISCISEPHHGTTFSIYFPRSDEPPASQQPEEVVDLPRGNEVILLAEDEPAVRALVAQTLRRQGYVVIEAANGIDALRAYEAHVNSAPSLLVTDVIMPQMGGLALVEQLRARQPDLRVLLISGYADSMLPEVDHRNASIALLQKPFSPTALAHKVRQILDH